MVDCLHMKDFGYTERQKSGGKGGSRRVVTHTVFSELNTDSLHASRVDLK